MADTIGSLLFASGFAPDALKSLQSAADNLAKQVKLNIPVTFGGAGGSSTPPLAGFKPAIDAVSESTKKLANETATLRNQFIAGDKSAADVRTRLEQLKVSANAAAVGLDLTTKEARALSLVGATTERTLNGMAGSASRLGLASQVSTGILGSLQGVTAQLSGSLGPLGTILPGVVGTSGLGGLGAAGVAAGAGLVAVAAGAVASVNAFKAFEINLKGAQTVLEATDEQAKLLARTALQIGPALGILGKDAAKGFEELGSAGLNVTDVINGAGLAVANLAVATKTNIGEAAEIFGQAKNAFGITGAGFASVADIITNAANQTSLKVSDFRDAIGQGGAAAKFAGLDLAEYSAVIASIKPQFSSASDAGTSFKTFIASLSGKSKEAKAALQELGFSAFTAAGDFKPFNQIVDELREKFSGLSKQKTIDLSNKIFGSDAGRTLLGLLGQTGQGITDLAAKINTQGSAAKQASDRNDTLEGSFTKLSSSVNALAVRLGERLAPALKVAVDGLTAFLGFFNSSESDGIKKFTDQAKGLEDQILRLKNSGGLLAGLQLGNTQAALDATNLKIKALQSSISQKPAVYTGAQFGPPAPTASGSSASPYSSQAPVVLPDIAGIKELVSQAKALQSALDAANKSLDVTRIKAARDALDAFTSSTKYSVEQVAARNQALSIASTLLQQQTQRESEAAAAAKQATADRVAAAKVEEAARKALAATQARLNDQLDDTNRKFKAGLADGKVTQSQLEAYQQRVISFADSARDAGVTLSKTFLATAAALEKQAAALAVQTKAVQDLAAAERIRRDEAVKIAAAAFKASLGSISDTELGNTIKINQALIVKAQLALKNAKNEKEAAAALDALNKAQEKISALEAESVRRGTEALRVYDATRTAKEEGLELEIIRTNELAATRAAIAADERSAAELRADEADALATQVEATESVRDDVTATLIDARAYSGEVSDLNSLLEQNSALLSGDRDLTLEQKAALEGQATALKAQLEIRRAILGAPDQITGFNPGITPSARVASPFDASGIGLKATQAQKDQFAAAQVKNLRDTENALQALDDAYNRNEITLTEYRVKTFDLAASSADLLKVLAALGINTDVLNAALARAAQTSEGFSGKTGASITEAQQFAEALKNSAKTLADLTDGYELGIVSETDYRAGLKAHIALLETQRVALAASGKSTLETEIAIARLVKTLATLDNSRIQRVAETLGAGKGGLGAGLSSSAKEALRLRDSLDSAAARAADAAARTAAIAEAAKNAREQFEQTVDAIARIGKAFTSILDKLGADKGVTGILNGIIDTATAFAKGDIIGGIVGTVGVIVELFDQAGAATRAFNKALEDTGKQLKFINANQFVSQVDGPDRTNMFGRRIQGATKTVVDEAGLSIAKSLESGVSSGLSSGFKAFFDGTGSVLDGLRNGIRDAIISGILEAVVQKGIIQGALGGLLGQLTTAFAAGDTAGVAGIVKQIGAALPELAAQLETTLAPLVSAVNGAFGNPNAPKGAEPATTNSSTPAGDFFTPFISKIDGGVIPDSILIFNKSSDTISSSATLMLQAANIQYGAAELFERAVRAMPRPSSLYASVQSLGAV